MEQYMLFNALAETTEELEMLKQIIEQLKNEELYIRTTDYDWDENAKEVYELFDMEEYIENTKKLIRR